jgi:CheY-like chemotaxis protein
MTFTPTMPQNLPLKRILFVDDDAVYRMTIEYLFKHSYPDIEMLSIAEACEVLPALESFNPDLMILDVNLPISTGWEVLDDTSELFRQSPELKPYIAMSSSSIDLDDTKRAKTRLDVDAYLEKPLTLVKIEHLFTAYQEKVEVVIR